MPNSKKTACSKEDLLPGWPTASCTVLGGRQVGEEQHPGRSAETTGQISEERVTSNAIPFLDPSRPGLAHRPQRLLWRTNSLPLLSDFMGAPQGLGGAPEERWASWQGQTAKSQDFQVPRVLPIIPRPEGWDERSLILLSFLHVFFNP